MLTKVLRNGKIVTPNPAQAMEGLEILVTAFKENHKITEEESTKRVNIEAMKDVELEKIRSQKEILKLYFENIFAERKVMIEGMFDALDKGIESNNSEIITQSMGAIVTIAKESPLKDMQTLLSDFNNPDVDSITI